MIFLLVIEVNSKAIINWEKKINREDNYGW